MCRGEKSRTHLNLLAMHSAVGSRGVSRSPFLPPRPGFIGLVSAAVLVQAEELPFQGATTLRLGLDAIL
jgi:hypothetical protein